MPRTLDTGHNAHWRNRYAELGYRSIVREMPALPKFTGALGLRQVLCDVNAVNA